MAAPKPSNNAAVEELIALRQEIAEFRKDFKKLNAELSLRIAFGVIGSLALLWLAAAAFGLLMALL